MPTKKPTTASSWVDPEEAPPLDREWFDRAEIRDGDRLIRRAGGDRRGTGEMATEAVTIRLDTDVLAYFRATGRGWQSRINKVLREAAGL